MKSRAEKERDWPEFMQSTVSYSTVAYLFLFFRNIKRMFNMVLLDIVVAEKLEKGEIEHSMTPDQVDETRHFIMLTALSRLMVMLETLFAVGSTLITKPRVQIDLGETLTRYNSGAIKEFAAKVRAAPPMWDLLCFPDLDVVAAGGGLSPPEKSLLAKILDESVNYFHGLFMELAEFHTVNEIAYNKFKHGLPLIVAAKGPGDLPSVTYAFDRRREPPEIVCLQVRPPVEGWFNAVTIVPYSPQTFEKYRDLLKKIELVVKQIVNNIWLWISNCGEDYVPLVVFNNRWESNIVVARELQNIEAVPLSEVIGKIVAGMNLTSPGISTWELKFDSPADLEKLKMCFSAHAAATLYAGDPS